MRAAASSGSSSAPPAAAGYTKKRVASTCPYRMLEVEAAANAVYAWAAEQILARRLPEERPTDPAEYAAAVHHEEQALRHRAHHKLMQAFLEPEIFDGTVAIKRARRADSQLKLVDPDDLTDRAMGLARWGVSLSPCVTRTVMTPPIDSLAAGRTRSVDELVARQRRRAEPDRRAHGRVPRPPVCLLRMHCRIPEAAHVVVKSAIGGLASRHSRRDLRLAARIISEAERQSRTMCSWWTLVGSRQR